MGGCNNGLDITTTNSKTYNYNNSSVIAADLSKSSGAIVIASGDRVETTGKVIEGKSQPFPAPSEGSQNQGATPYRQSDGRWYKFTPDGKSEKLGNSQIINIGTGELKK